MVEKKSLSRTVHVVPAAGGWVITKAGSRKVSRIYQTQREAARAAEAAIQRRGGEILTKQRDGRLRASFTLGRTGAEKLNAVEGIRLSREMGKAFRDFDKNNLSPSERRKAIAQKFSKKS